MKIATWNVNGIRARGEQVAEWLTSEKPDIVCLQEIKAPRDKVPAPLVEHAEYWGFWHGFKGYSGVALLVRKSLSADPPPFMHPPFDLENRIVVATIDTLTVASIYVPNGGRNFSGKLTFLKALEAYAEEAKRPRHSLVLCGDFNVAHRPIDVHPKERGEFTGQLPVERDLIDGILSHNLVDLGRKFAPDDDGLFTWWAPWRQMKQRNIGWRLDYIYATGALAQKAVSCVVQKSVGTSDHAPVVATFDA